MPQDKHLKALSYWLFICCFSVFCMIIIGAITRLSGSGLSMVEWKPIIGALPPLSEVEWLRVFDLYKQSPEFQKKNFWMELSDFKSIFFWEWAHRLFGRLIGIIYVLPFMFFLVRGWIPQGYKLKLFGLFILGGAQGFMGWYMVKSGLVDIPAVSHYRLAAHLSLALLIYGLMLWLALTFRKGIEQTQKTSSTLYNHGLLTLSCLVLTILWGAYTAGLDAGLVYNDSFPKMGKTWIPEEIWLNRPIWVNIFEDYASVQFLHRWLAMTTLCIALSFAVHALKKNRKEFCSPAVAVVVLLQFGLGIATLLSKVHMHIAVAHQAGAVILLTTLIICLHALHKKPK